jgi:hypothetical protein
MGATGAAFAATTALTDVVSMISSGSDFVGCGAGFVSTRGADLVKSAAGAVSSPGSMDTEIFSPSRRMATVKAPTPAQS